MRFTVTDMRDTVILVGAVGLAVIVGINRHKMSQATLLWLAFAAEFAPR